MFPEIAGTALSVLVCGVVLAVVGSEEHLTRIERQTATPGLCVLPEPLLNGRYRPSGNRCPPGNVSPACLMAPGAYVPNDWVLFFKCDEGYASNTTQPVTICKDGRWVPPLPFCKSESCPTLNAYGVDMKCTYVGETVPCEDPMRPGSVVTLTCKAGYDLPFEPRSTQLTCLDVGAWDYPPFYCTPGKVEEVSTTLSTPSLVTTQELPPLVNKSVESKVEEVSTTLSTPSLVTTQEILPEVRKSVQKCQEYAAILRTGTCAIRDTPIRDQKNALPHEYPHMAIIGLRGKAQVIWRCGGSLISERFVLGCASCCERYESGGSRLWILGSFARLGAHEFFSTRIESGAQDYDIIDRIFHPQFNEANNHNDIALYKLKDNVKFNDFIRPICLQTEDTFANTYAIYTGLWHFFNGKFTQGGVLQKNDITIIDNDQCTKLFWNELRVNENVSTFIICGKQHNHDDTTRLCKDNRYNGGPLQIRQQKLYCMYSLVGVLDFGLHCNLGGPWVYAKVSYYVPWIESVVWP